jgi:hypothetical protein
VVSLPHRREEISCVDQMCPPAEHLMRTVDLLSRQLMQHGLLDLIKVLRSDGSGKPVYNWWCNFREIPVCFFISSLDKTNFNNS